MGDTNWASNVVICAADVSITPIVTNMAKRDMIQFDSPYIPVTGKTKRLMVFNGLNQAVSTQILYSPDKVMELNAGTPRTTSAGTALAVYNETDTTLTGLALISGFIKVRLTFSIAPTAGNLTVRLDQSPL